MSSEKQPLFDKSDIQSAGTKPVRIKPVPLRHIVVIPFLFLFSFGDSLNSYVTNEWIQAEIWTEHFPNTTTNTNFSSCDDHNKSDTDYANYKFVQQSSAQWFMYNKLAYIVPSIITSLLFPSYSDSLGRKGILTLCVFGACLRYCGIAVVIFLEQKFYYILGLYFIHGLFGGGSSAIAIMCSYIADITTGEQQRVKGIMVLDFSLLLGSIIASLLSGVFIQTLDLRYNYTCAISGGVLVFVLFLTISYLPETLPETQRQPIRSVVSTLKRTFAFYASSDFKGKRLSYIILIIAFMFSNLCETNRSSLEILYFLGQPFCWGPAFIGYFTMTCKASQGVFGLAVVKLLEKYMSISVIATLSCISNTGSYILEGLARTDYEIYCVPVVAMLAFLIFPMIRGLMSNMTSPDKQGSLFAGLGMIQIVGELLAITSNEVYAATLSIMDGFVFLCMAGLTMIECSLILCFCCVQSQKTMLGDSEKEVSISKPNRIKNEKDITEF